MKILKNLENELEKVNTANITFPPVGGTSSPAEILAILSAFKGVLVTVLSFVKLFTSDKADTKIDTLIKWLNSLP